MYKLIVCDLDETLMKDDGSLSSKNAEAIQAATNAGIYFVVNSGRGYSSFQKDLEKMNLRDKPNQYSISYNGGLILENKNNRPITINAMPFNTAKEVFEIGKNNQNASIHINTQNKLYIYNPVPEDIAYQKSRGVIFSELKNDDFNQFRDMNIMKVIMALPTVEERQNMKKMVEKKVGSSNLSISFSSGRYVEFNPAKIDKGSATLELADTLGIHPNEIIAVGDNSNDQSMLDVAGLPISVANGIDSIKKTAKYITTADNNHDALAEIINKFIL
jgi:Cof subfamily protein (haloacid dehalogenase superfamily)